MEVVLSELFPAKIEPFFALLGRRQKRYRLQHHVQFLLLVFWKIKCNRVIEEVGALLIRAKKGPGKIKTMFKGRRDKHGTGGESSQLTDNTCQKTNRDNLSINEFMRKIKSSFQILRGMKEEHIGAGDLAGCNISSATGLEKKIFDDRRRSISACFPFSWQFELESEYFR